VLAEALRAARAIQAESARADAILAVAERLPPDVHDLHYEVWQMACHMANGVNSSQFISLAASGWLDLSRAAGKSETQMVSDTLNAFAPAGRPQLLRIIEALLPVIHRLGGERAVRETARAIIDTAKWWP